jgi:uncharacterized protein YndB with AHSA1/START domain
MSEPVTGSRTAINAQAPVVGRSEIEIAASPEAVWEVLTAFERWPRWNREVKSMSMEGPVSPGTVFRWKAGRGRSRRRSSRPNRRG